MIALEVRDDFFMTYCSTAHKRQGETRVQKLLGETRAQELLGESRAQKLLLDDLLHINVKVQLSQSIILHMTRNIRLPRLHIETKQKITIKYHLGL